MFCGFFIIDIEINWTGNIKTKMAIIDFALTILQPDTKSKRPLNLLIMSTKVSILSKELMLMVFVITGNASQTFNAKIN